MRRLARPLLPGQKAVMGRREIEIGQAMRNESENLASKYESYDVYLHDNRSDTNQEHFEPTLFVGRKPHQVRSFADSGVCYNMDNETGRLEIGLEDPVMKPEYEIDSVLPVTAHKLCLNCLDALNYFCRYREQQAKHDTSDDEKSRLELSNSVIHHANLFSLFARAEIDECSICTTIYRRLNRWDLSYPQYEDYRIEFAFPQVDPSNLHEHDLLEFAMVRSDKKKEPVWNWSILLELRLWPEDKYLHHFQAQLTQDDLDPEEYRSMSPDELSVNNSPLARGIVKSWVRKCMANEDGKHVECNRQDNDYLPTRLLDVRHAAKTSCLRIVCPRDDPSLFVENRKYTTLSHCWGSWGASENPSLTMENLEVRKSKGLSCETLPMTFNHALKVAGWLNIPYLWIDSLCIIQNSRSDWIHEASFMHHTYQCSTVNISASHGTDSRAGLFYERDPIFITAQQLRAPKLSKQWYVTRDNVFGWTTVSPAFSRAWIHRERQLAPRILHFMLGEIVWECSGTDGASFASETLPGGAPFKNLWNGNSKYQSNSTIVKSKQGKQMTYALWNNLCKTFSTKELTVKSDMPIIMSSLAQEFHRSLPGDEYLAGMWRDTLPQALAWHTNRFWPEGDTNSIAPTWSWLSAPAPIGVSLVEKARTERLISLAKLVDVDIVREDEYKDNRYGPVKSCALRLEGFMRKIWFTFDGKGGFELAVVDTLVDGEEDDNSKSTLREIGKNWDEYEGEVCEAEFDGKIKDEEYCCWCMFTSIEEWIDDRNIGSQWREITAILLEESDDKEGQWIRTGMMRMKDLFALKMRYKECWELDTDSDDEEKDEQKDETAKTDQSENENTHDSVDDTKTQDVQQEGLVESSNEVTDTSTEAPEDQKPQAEQSPPETNQNTSETEDTATSESEPKAQSETENKQTKSSPAATSDPWPRMARFIQRKRFEVCQIEKAAEKALKDKAKSKDDDDDDARQNNHRDDENKTENENENNRSVPNQSVSEQQTPAPTSTPDPTTAATQSSSPSPPPPDQSGTPQDPPNPSNSHKPSDPDPQTTAAVTTSALPQTDTTPIHGHTNLDPFESLYQFDQSLAQIQAQGYFKWLRRLDVREIEIV